MVEWTECGEQKIGVIDCNKSSGTNPIIDRISDVGYDRLEFVVMSHPHHDHFSGLLPLLKYCLSEKFPVGFFAYTTREISAFWNSLVLSNNEQDDLADIFRIIRKMEDSGLLEARGIGTDQMRALELKDGIKLQFLAPSEKERDAFASTLYDENGRVKDKPEANLVCSVLMIHSDDWHVLLTSDAERKSLKRIGLGPLKKDYRPLLLGQVPHHGAERNFYRAFWNNRKHDSGAPAPISVGPNPYGHPSDSTVREMREMDFEVRATGQPNHAGAPDISQELDLISELERDSINATYDAPRSLAYEFNPESTNLPTLRGTS